MICRSTARRTFIAPAVAHCTSLVAAALLAATAASAQTASAPDPAPADSSSIAEGEDIVVTGMGRNGYQLTADQLRDAYRAFARHQGEFAPQADLRWRVLPAGAAQGLSLRLVRASERLDIEVDEHGEFSLPAERILQGGWRLQSNAGRRQIRIRPLTFSPGSSDADFRLGDARLLCRVYWAFADNNVGPLTRAMFGAIGGCGSRRVAIYWSSEQPVAAVDSPPATVEVRPEGDAYRLPLHDRTLDNELRVRVRYR